MFTRTEPRTKESYDGEWIIREYGDGRRVMFMTDPLADDRMYIANQEYLGFVRADCLMLEKGEYVFEYRGRITATQASFHMLAGPFATLDEAQAAYLVLRS